VKESLFDGVGDILVDVAPAGLGRRCYRPHRYGIKVRGGPEQPICEHEEAKEIGHEVEEACITG